MYEHIINNVQYDSIKLQSIQARPKHFFTIIRLLCVIIERKKEEKKKLI